MIEINDVDISRLPEVLKKETIRESFYGLIQDAGLNCQKLDANGIKKGSSLLQAAENNELSELAVKTGIGEDYLQQLVRVLSLRSFKAWPLKKIEGVDAKYIANLLAKGIEDTGDLLLACKTEQDRMKLAEGSGVPLQVLMRIVRISDLMRLPGVRNTRATLYLEAGLDSVEKFSALESKETREYLTDFVEKTKIAKMAPLLKELETQIAWAKLYPIIVEF